MLQDCNAGPILAASYVIRRGDRLFFMAEGKGSAR